jgi:hypothetical protein
MILILFGTVKKVKGEGKRCHAKTMTNTEVDKIQT